MIRKFALIFGAIYLLVGILGFVPGMSWGHEALHAARPISVDTSHGLLLGLFPVNVLHNIVHLLIGIWGLLASRTITGARFYGQGLTVIYGLLAILGLIPNEMTKTLFGLVPIHGYDILLHAGSALVAAYFGFVARESDGLPANS